MGKPVILITGANGQIGSVLTTVLREKYGENQVIATDIREPVSLDTAPFELVDITDRTRLHQVVNQYKVTQIYHLAAILSAAGEKDPLFTWNINMNGLFNVLEVAREWKLDRVFFPSSIAIFGAHSGHVDTAQFTHLDPITVYGISKVAGEHWCHYYYEKYGLDVRSVRYPGIIGHESMPGGGTTDYAVEIYHQALLTGRYTCFLKAHTRLPMIFMEDAIRATIELMTADRESIKVRTSYNLAGMSFSPAEIAAAIRSEIPNFAIEYAPDFRQQIAESWPESIDDNAARKDWGWQPAFDLQKMTKEMLLQLGKKIKP